MHEMSIAQSIVELAEEQARNRHSEAVEELELEIGRLAGVELHTLDFALESAVKGSMLEHASIVRHIIDGEGACTIAGGSFRWMLYSRLVRHVVLIVLKSLKEKNFV